MDLPSLMTFRAVAEAGGVTAAAARLGTVQSAISARLAALERDLGAALFRRHARGVALTAAGELLLPYADRIAALAAEARRAVVNADGSPAGPFALGAVEVVAASRLPAALARLGRLHPAVELSLRTGVSLELAADVAAGRLDAAIVAGPVRGTRGVELRPLPPERLALLSSNDVPIAEARHAYAFKRGCACRARLETLVRRRRLHARIVELGSVEGILGCVRAGLGITLLPEVLAAGAAGVVAEPAGELPLHLLKRPGASPAAEAVAAELRARS